MSEVQIYDAKEQGTFFAFIRRNIKDFGIYRYAIFFLVKINIKMRYQRSALGFIWTMLNPLLMLATLATIFSLLYKMDFREYGAYLFSGLVPWQFVSMGLTGSLASLIGGEGYIKKIYVPKLMFPVVTCMTELINFLLRTASMLILLLIIGSKIGPTIVLWPLASILFTIFILGMTIFISVATVYLRDMRHIIEVLINVAFYATPILYMTDQIPERFQNLLYLNPFTHFIDLFHQIIYVGTWPTWSNWLICIIFAVLSLVIGLVFLYLRENDIVYQL